MATPASHMQKILPPYLRTDLISYTRRVCSLYKRMIRDQYYKNYDFLDARFEILKIRAEFDKNKNIKDIRKAKLLLLRAEDDFIKNMSPVYKSGYEWLPFTKHTGISYGREDLYPDYVLDAWHPLQKALYPRFFAKREEMKDEYIAIWKKKMVKPTVKEPHGAGGH